MPISPARTSVTAEMAVAGIDRWRGGWIVADHDGDHVSLWETPDIAELTSRLASHDIVAIDMPIALAPTGRREAEAALRSVLGSSARSVFTSPTRAAAAATTQQAATATNRAHGGPGISAQAFGLFASIRELRAALRGPRFDHWWETHPETSFAIMNHGVPMASKKSARGVAQRIVALRAHVADLDALLVSSPAKVPVDDVLDALAALWSGHRISSGTAICHGPTGRDDEGFALGIRI